jgi:gluconokinase
MDCILTIDINTSAVRIHGFDLNGQVLGLQKGSYPTFHPQADYSEQDPEQVFITTLFVLKNFLNEVIHPQKIKVRAISFCAAMHSVLAVDKNGRPLGNAIIWADNRGAKEANWLKNSPDCTNIYETTGTPIHPMSPLIKITWMKLHDPERFAQAYKFISLKEYVIFQLTGEFLIDHSMASSTGLFDIHQLKWHGKALDFAGISADRLSTPVSIFFDEVALKKEYCKTLRLSGSTKIILGSSDGCLATLGSGDIAAKKATITIASSGAARVASKEIISDVKQRFFNYLLADGYYISGGPTNNVGVVLDWFTQFLGDFQRGQDFEEVKEELIRDASQVPVGAKGLLFLPYLLGERAPLWNANARGVYFGLNITHEQKHMLRATIEGILFEVYSIGKLLAAHRTFNSISLTGSYARIPLFAQILTDIFGLPIHVNPQVDSVSLGAALVGLTSLNYYGSLEEASANIHFTKTYTPNHQNHDLYMRYFEIFESLSTKLGADFELITDLQ